MKTLVFAVAGYNLAETGRMIEIARVTASDVLAAIDRLLHDERAKREVETFRKQLAEWNGPENAARFLSEHYG